MNLGIDKVIKGINESEITSVNETPDKEILNMKEFYY